MYRRLNETARMVYPLLLGIASPALAQLRLNSLPAFISDKHVLIGKYHYKEANDGFKMDVLFRGTGKLNAAKLNRSPAVVCHIVA